MYRLLFLLLPLIFIACKGHTGAEPDFPENFSSASQGNSQDPNGDDTPVIPIIPEDEIIEDTTSVSDARDLPKCSAANEGETFMVAAENTVYFCVNGTWRNDVVELVGVSCENGVLTAGAAEPAVGAPSSFGLDTLTGEYVFRRQGVAVAGIAEKGPFRHGTSVTVVELDSVMRLADSDRSHRTCITTGDGSYSFAPVDLVSPYVRVEAKGFFRNELTGGLSADLVTLTAVTDLTERDSVNVNMLTHLEGPRTLKMIENTGNNQPIRMVKEQALKDILYSFGIKIDGFNDASFAQGQQQGGFGGFGQAPSATKSMTADDISLFDDGEFSAALIAVSIMMQRKGSGDEMLAYADGIADRIRGNGNWDDWGARADLADWLMVLDTSGSYRAIRKNLESMTRGTVPDFETHLRNFWTGAYQFPACNAQTAGTVTHIGYSQSAFFVSYYADPNGPRTRFICDGSTNLWRTATDIEKDTVGLGADTTKYDGAFRQGVINQNKTYVYEEAKNSWRPITSDDVMEFTPVEEVYAGLAADEQVVFVLRHAERTNETGEKGHLTDGGKLQAQGVGKKFVGAGPFYFGYSGYTRTLETCENIALGGGQSNVSPEIIDGLDGDYYIKDQSRYGAYKASDGGSLNVYTKYVYRDMYADAFYDLEKRSKEFVSTYILANRGKLQKVNFYISHDMMVLPLAVYASQKKVNLRYFDNRNWLNFLTGVAVIFNSAGTVRYVPVRGLETGIQII
ncbi:MAG: histidine phosphatase family protein [Fibrobacter sp.]|nr:histidine phosphatase family protein [Fibrobacter sp.]